MTGQKGTTSSRPAWLLAVAVALVAILFCSYYYSVARRTDICFDGAVFLQPIVALERTGVLTHTYNTESPKEFHLPLTNLGQGMLSQGILNWPFIHFFGINHLTLQAANLIFLLLGGLLMSLLVWRLTGNRVLCIAALLLFYTAPQMKGLGLQGLGEVPAASYLLLCALLLHLVLSTGRWFWLLGLAAFVAFHTKNYLILVYPMLLTVLAYLWLRQKALRFSDLLRFSAAFWACLLALPLFFIARYGWDSFMTEISDFWTLIASTQWGTTQGTARRDPELTLQAVRELSTNYGGWYHLYIPIAIGHLVAACAILVRPANEPRTAPKQPGVRRTLLSRLPALDPTQAVLVFLLGASIFYVGYWFHFSTWAIWYRRVFPFLILQGPLWLIALHRVWEAGKSRPVMRVLSALGAGAMLLLAFAHVSYFVRVYDAPLPDELALRDRIEATEFVRSMPPDARLFGLGWWQAPKLSMFSGRTFLDLTTRGESYDEGYLVLDRETMGIAADGVASRLSSMETKVVWQNGSNKVIQWKRYRIDMSTIREEPSLKLLRMGPDRSTTAGERFYAQPGGTFAMWLATEGATSKTVVAWNGQLLHSSVNPDGKLMTAMVPRALFAKAGRYPIALYDRENRRRSGVLTMEIEAAK